jgi:hypothetical protein
MITPDKTALPSTPMTGPTSSLQRRRLESIPQQDGNGESETDFAAYTPPARPSDLEAESMTPTFAVQLGRRHLNNPMQRRRLL